MLIPDGYAHSLKALLDKNRVEEAFPRSRGLRRGWTAHARHVMEWFAGSGAGHQTAANDSLPGAGYRSASSGGLTIRAEWE